MNTLAAETASAWYLTLRITMSAIRVITAYNSWDGDPVMKWNHVRHIYHSPWRRAQSRLAFGKRSSQLHDSADLAGIYRRASPKSSAELARRIILTVQVMAYGLPYRFRSCVVRSDSLPESPPMKLPSPRTLHAARYTVLCTWTVVYVVEKVQRRLWENAPSLLSR